MSLMDLLKDLTSDQLSEASGWKRLYDSEVMRGNQFFERLSDAQCQLMKCEAQRASLIGFVRLAATMLEVSYPGAASGLREKLQDLETDYAKPLPPLKSSRAISRAIPGGSTNEAGSGAVPEAASKLESPQGIQTPHRYSTKPPAIPPVPSYSGEWDEVSK